MLNPNSDPGLRRIRWITWSVVIILVVWQFLPMVERYLVRLTADAEDGQQVVAADA